MVLRIEGDHAYGCAFESGGHRVQRVPATETQGRIHTSACTVAVMPEPDEAEAIKINPADLRIDTFRASGAGGQHINKTDSAVRITHLPTGIVAECQDGRSQHSNKAKALQVLQARIQDGAQRARRQGGRHAQGPDRQRRPQRPHPHLQLPAGPLTDHRINLTLYKLQLVMDGDLGEVLATRCAPRARRPFPTRPTSPRATPTWPHCGTSPSWRWCRRTTPATAWLTSAASWMALGTTSHRVHGCCWNMGPSRAAPSRPVWPPPASRTSRRARTWPGGPG
jgi:protein subunit release factor B